MAIIAPLRRPRGSTPLLPPVTQEAARLLDLAAVSQKIRAGQEVISAGRSCPAVFVLLDGMAIRYRMLRDGQRQILEILVPGDFVGVVSCRYEKALYTIRTLTPSVIAPIPVHQFAELCQRHPELATRLFWELSCRSTLLSERLIAVGRLPAKARVAQFLLELLVRLQTVGLADDSSYPLPLTQEMIGDALGLSIPYLNRILHELRDDGLVVIKDQSVFISDVEELSAIADFERAYLHPAPVAAPMRRAAAGNQPARHV